MKTLEPIMKRKLVGTRWNKIWEKQIKNKRLAWQPQEKKKKKKRIPKNHLSWNCCFIGDLALMLKCGVTLVFS